MVSEEMIINKIKEEYKKAVKKIRFGVSEERNMTMVEIYSNNIDKVLKGHKKLREKAKDLDLSEKVPTPKSKKEFDSWSVKKKAFLLGRIYQEDIDRIRVEKSENEGFVRFKIYNNAPTKLKNMLIGFHEGMLN